MVEKCPFAIRFLVTYVIVMGVSNLSGNIMDLFIMDMKKIISKGMGVEVLVEISDSDT